MRRKNNVVFLNERRPPTITHKDPKLSLRRAKAACHQRDIERHILLIDRMGKKAYWKHLQQFTGFFGKDRFEVLVSDIKKYLLEREAHGNNQQINNDKRK